MTFVLERCLWVFMNPWVFMNNGNICIGKLILLKIKGKKTSFACTA